jgi:hypothetical protein
MSATNFPTDASVDSFSTGCIQNVYAQTALGSGFKRPQTYSACIGANGGVFQGCGKTLSCVDAGVAKNRSGSDE